MYWRASDLPHEGARFKSAPLMARADGRYSDLQALPLPGFLVASASQPKCASAYGEAFVPVHRCGAAPASHRIPYFDAGEPAYQQHS